MWKYKRFLSLFLIVIFICVNIPINVLAQDFNDLINSIVPSTQLQEKNKTEAKIQKEVEEKREKNVKHFMKDDMTYEAVVYPMAVHYQENGKWKDIDNNIVAGKDDENIDVLENKSNSFKAEFGKKSDAEKLVSIKKDDYEISWNINKPSETNILSSETAPSQTTYDTNTAKAVNSTSTVVKSIVEPTGSEVQAPVTEDKTLIQEKAPTVETTTTNSEQVQESTVTQPINNNSLKVLNSTSAQIKPENTDYLKGLSENDKKKTLSNLTSSVEFKDIYQNVDLEYEVRPEDVKETIVINKNTDNTYFEFNINSKNLTAKLQADKSIIFYDAKDLSKKVFIMDAPYMIDAKNQQSKDIVVGLTQTKAGYILSLKPNKEWLDNSERVYPIKIDPTVTTDVDIASIQDTFVSSSQPTSNYYNNILLETGYGALTGKTRTYMKFTLPTLTSADMVTNAQLGLALVTNNTNLRQVNAYGASGDWDSRTLTWNNQPGYDWTVVEDYQMVQNVSSGYFWDVTSSVKDWYNTGNNFGIVLQHENEGPDCGYNEFLSSDTTIEAGRPRITIQYVNNSGIEGYWTYHSQNVGKAGTGYVNDYNGNLVFIHDDLNMNGNKMPISLTHVFNSNNKDVKSGYGLGWMSNLNQRLVSETIGTKNYYVYTDGDGTKHYFENTGATILKDESGLDLTLTVNPDKSYIIKDKGGNELGFVPGGYLYTIKDNNQNTLTLNYNGTTLAHVTDGAGRVTDLESTAEGYLIGIVDPSGRRTSFSYNGIQLSRITYSDGKYSLYTYDSNNNLTSATNFDGYKMQYIYYNSSPYRVQQIHESNVSPATDGQGINIVYGSNTTTYNDFRGKKNIYQFNDAGNTLGIRDDDGEAQYYSYNEGPTNKNKLQLESKLQKSVMNLLSNHSLEFIRDWDSQIWTGSTGSCGYSTAYKYLGAQSLSVSKTNSTARQFYRQTLSLEKGKTYTLSGYIKTENVENKNKKGAVIFVNYQDKTGAYQTADSEYVSGTKDWSRYQVTFTVPSDAAGTTAYIGAGIAEEVGTSYFDCLQLEEGTAANRYNLIENPNFIYGTGTPDFWTKNYECTTSDTLATSYDATYPTKLDSTKKIFRITGVADKRKNIAQNVKVSGSIGDTFVLGGWAKGYSAAIKDSRIFALDVELKNAVVGQPSQWVMAKFNPDSGEWQYVSDKFAATINYSSINFYTLYYENENYADFDGLQLYKEEFGPSYTYDPKGNIVSTSDLAKQQSTFEYDANNNLVKSINPKGNSFNYTYDAKHNVQTATSAENVKSTFTYDAAGNPLTAKVEGVNDASTFIQAQSTYSTSGNYMKTVEDSVGNTVNYDYDETKGTLNSVTDPKGKATSYLYDNLDRLQSVSKTADALAVTNSYSYANDRIESITHNGFNYNFGYDPLGNNTTVGVGTQNLITNNYEARTGKLLGSTYGNNQTAALAYDSEDREISRMYGGIEKFTYSYDASGNVASHDDKVNGSNYKYVYDASERLVNIIEKLTVSPSVRNVMNYDYDIESNLKTFRENVNGFGHINSYEYDKDSKITDIFYNNPYKNDGNVENFPLNGTTTGTLGTKPYSESATFGKDNTGKTVLVPNSTTKILYDLGLKKDEGALGTWFNTAGLASTRYLIASEGKNGSALHMYLKADNKLAFAVRDSAGAWKELIVSTIAASSNVWHYGAFDWKLNGSILSYSLNLDGQDYAGTIAISTIKDFSGATTAVGGHNSGAYQLNGNLEQFSYYAKALTGAEITDIYNKGRGNGVKYLYDSIGRLKDRTISTGTLNNQSLKTSYEYEAGNIVIDGKKSTSTQVKSIDNDGKKIAYTYDKNGNIATIIENSKEVEYYYNELNELTSEKYYDTELLNKTITYTYDVGGNILNKVETAPETATKTSTYAYDDTNWKDKLTSYDGNTINYDQIGNPLSYNGDTYTWEQGRQLAGKTGNGKDITFKYNDSGIRTQKTVNGVTTNYHLTGDKVTYEANSTDKIYYTYDASGQLVSMNLTSTATPSINGEYYYIRNAQGDIIGLFDKTGTQVVSYVYDSWGKLISTTGSLASTVGVKNPYRYRGYRYDTETGLYYLQSRYYNADWGRFINADEIAAVTGELLSANMFAYCKNNPTTLKDPSGFRPVLTEGEETDAMREASYKAMNTVARNRSSNSSITSEGYRKNSRDRERSKNPLRSRGAKKREKSEIDSALGKRGSKEREQKSQELHRAKKKNGDSNYNNKEYGDLVDGNFDKIFMNPVGRIGLFAIGTSIIIGTIVEDVATGGAGIVDDGVTISGGSGLIIKAFGRY